MNIKPLLVLGMLLLLMASVAFAAYGPGSPPSPSGSSSSSSSSGGGGGGGSTTVCTIGAISCEGSLQYKECIKSGTKNAWSEIKNVSSGKNCRFGRLITVEADAPAAKEVAPPTAEQIPTAEAEGSVPEAVPESAVAGQATGFGKSVAALAWLWVTIAVIVVAIMVGLSIYKKKQEEL